MAMYRVWRSNITWRYADIFNASFLSKLPHENLSLAFLCHVFVFGLLTLMGRGCRYGVWTATTSVLVCANEQKRLTKGRSSQMVGNETLSHECHDWFVANKRFR